MWNFIHSVRWASDSSNPGDVQFSYSASTPTLQANHFSSLVPLLSIFHAPTMTSTTPPEVAARVEAYIPRFKLTRLLNQDQAGRRISLLGEIDSQPAVLIAERAAFAADHDHLASFPTSLTKIKNLGANDIYSWFLANSNPDSTGQAETPPDFKLNLIYPCTEKHAKKYSAQGLRVVSETPEVYSSYIRPWIQRQREKGTLNWVFNIIEGRTEQEDVIYREHGDEGFLLLPDLNWDRKTLPGLHLLGLVERRDIWSVRDLKKSNIEWLKHMRNHFLDSTVKLYPDIDRDQLKLYVHCMPPAHTSHMLIHRLTCPQTSPLTTTSISTSCTSPSKRATRKPLVKRSVLKASSPSSKPCREGLKRGCKT